MTGHWIDLGCHPSKPCAIVSTIQALVRRSDTQLHVTFRLHGDISQLLVPPPTTPRIAAELWRSTCFEVFIAVEGQVAYHEFNFSPSGEWAVRAFRGYRSGRLLRDETMRPPIAVRATASQLELDAVVKLDSLSPAHPNAALRIGLSAVIDTTDGISYWALRHPAGKPDFHDAEGFALRLEPPCSRR